MKLRELINRLEELSNNGRNDNMHIEAWSEFDNEVVDGNRIGNIVKAAHIDRYVSENDEYEFIILTTE